MVATNRLSSALVLAISALFLTSAGLPGKCAATQNPVIVLAQNGLISKHQAIAIAKRRHKGKVLSAQLIKTDPPYYKIKMLTPQSRVKFIRVAAYRNSKG